MIDCEEPRPIPGGDYTDEQWHFCDKRDECLRMPNIQYIDWATPTVFSWEPNTDCRKYWGAPLEKTSLTKINENGTSPCLARVDAAHPCPNPRRSWCVLKVDQLEEDRRTNQRHNQDPNSTSQWPSQDDALGNLYEDCKDHQTRLICHVSNPGYTYCYCNTCPERKILWLRHQVWTLERSTPAWNGDGWGHTKTCPDEISQPNFLSEPSDEHWVNQQGISICWKPSQSDAYLTDWPLERKSIDPTDRSNWPLSDNLMGTDWEQCYFPAGLIEDVVTPDNYPTEYTPGYNPAMCSDLMQWPEHYCQFMLDEQTKLQQNAEPYNSLEDFGVMEWQDYQALPIGFRTSPGHQLDCPVGACPDKLGAVPDHVGHRGSTDSPDWHEIQWPHDSLSAPHGDARVPDRLPDVFDWENQDCTELYSGDSIPWDYVQWVHPDPRALEFIYPDSDMIGTPIDLSKYQPSIATVFRMVKAWYACGPRSPQYPGGTRESTFFQGIVNRCRPIQDGGYKGEWQDCYGIWYDPIDALKHQSNTQIVLLDREGYTSTPQWFNYLFDREDYEGAPKDCWNGSDFVPLIYVLSWKMNIYGDLQYVDEIPDSFYLYDFWNTVCYGFNPLILLIYTWGVEKHERDKDGTNILDFERHNNIYDWQELIYTREDNVSWQRRIFKGWDEVHTRDL
nr:beta-galactosidase [uncultured bacterium]